MRRMIGQIVYNAEGGGGGGGTPGGAPEGGGASAHPVVAPWNGVQGMWTIGEGETAKPWYEALPDAEAREHVKNKGYTSPAELALANYNLTKIQREGVVIPGPNASTEEVKAFQRKLGVPDTPDGYNETLKFEGVKVDENFLNWGKNTFHELGIPPSQAKALADKWNTYIADYNTKEEQQRAETNDRELADLTSRWGNDLDQNKAAGKRVVEALGLSNDIIERVEANIGTAAIVELLAMIGRKSDEGGFLNGGSGDPNDPANMTKEQAQAAIATLQADDEFQKRYRDAKHPGHKEAVSRMEKLFARS